MKKHVLQSIIIIIGIGAIFSVVKSSQGANDVKESNFFVGEKAMEIDGMLHRVDYYYGSVQVRTSESMLTQLKVQTYSEDRITYFPDPKLGLGSSIIIERANAVSINDGGEEKIYRTWKTTIDEVLAENKIELGDKDKVEPDINTRLADFLYKNNRPTEGEIIGKITITRVAETEVKSKEDINYKTITKNDPDLEKGKTRVETQGEKGVRELTYLVTRENGKEISRKLIKSEIAKEAKDKVIYQGTKVIIYGTGTATWYSLIGGMTAASNTLPYGTMVHVVNTANGKSVDVKVVDHGIQGSAIIDLADEAFQKIAPLGQGIVQVRLEKP
jgi:hypothetical protein